MNSPTSDYWHKQTKDEPLYPDLIWSRPENKQQAGKLLIIGGNAFGFAAAAQAYTTALKSGIGSCRVLLPDSLQKTVGRMFEAGEYAPSTPSGSFSKKALATVLDLCLWADAVLIAGDLGHNSETAVLLESLATSYKGQLSITQDAADYFTLSPASIIKRSETLLVLSFSQLQKLSMNAHYDKAFTFDMGIIQLVELLHDFTCKYPLGLIVKHHDQIFCARNGEITSTKLAQDLPVWRINTAARAGVWWLQNPAKPLEALSTSLLND